MVMPWRIGFKQKRSSTARPNEVVPQRERRLNLLMGETVLSPDCGDEGVPTGEIGRSLQRRKRVSIGLENSGPICISGPPDTERFTRIGCMHLSLLSSYAADHCAPSRQSLDCNA